ncbi:glycosyltransferase [Risungbinella massiliensis]|uniref:glycosyltransferase n=1 Tax=Risungbinella massiliensis TaxID=1329796 RepID=UPI0005CC67AA|nr:glycosyltransferase [Risungbinella massiliensis]
MKVMIFAPSQSIHTHKWATYLQKQANTDVVVVSFENHYSAENAKEVRTIALPSRLPGKLSYFPAIFSLKKVIQKEQPDILHAHYASSYGFIASWVSFHPTIVSVWGSDIYEFPRKNTLQRYIVERSLQKADLVCSTSQAMAEETRKYTAKKIEVTPFGVDTELFQPVEKEDSVYLRIGIAKGLKDLYGYPELLQGFADFVRAGRKAELYIMGDGEERDKYEEMVAQLNISKEVHFLGHVSNREVANKLQELDVFILPSHQDSFGVAALEAQAAGVPVAVHRVGGLPEVVLDQTTGLIMDGNSPRHITETLQWFADHQTKRYEMGKAAAEFVREQYSWSESGKRMKRIYQEILEKKGE